MQVMLDLETLGKGPGCTILSLGAAAFNYNAVESNFYTTLNRKKFAELGFVEDPETLAWWESQPNNSILLEADIESTPLSESLQAFADWLGWVQCDGIWGNGSDFDNAILAFTYRALNMPIPWHYRQSRCYRTLCWLNPEIKFAQPYGEKHNARNDAMNQADHAVRMLRRSPII